MRGLFGTAVVLAAVHIEFGQGVFATLVPGLTVAAEVDGSVEGLAHGGFVGLVLAGDVIGYAVVWAGAYEVEACGEVDAVLHGEHLEGYESLVVVHGRMPS